MNKPEIKLPPLPEWTEWPSTVADMSVLEIKEAMQSYARAAIDAARAQQSGGGE